MKSRTHVNGIAVMSVAPLVGAWIEIRTSTNSMASLLVAPLVGAWIEIDCGLRGTLLAESLPSWERGLKFYSVCIADNRQCVAPLVGAWIEICCIVSQNACK